MCFKKDGDISTLNSGPMKYRGTTVIASVVYDVLLWIFIWPKVEKNLGKNRTAFGEINPRLLRFWLFIE